MDLTKFESIPTYRDMRLLQEHLLGRDYSIRDTIEVEKVNYEIHEDFLRSSKPRFNNSYYNVGTIINRPQAMSNDPNILFQSSMFLTNNEK